MRLSKSLLAAAAAMVVATGGCSLAGGDNGAPPGVTAEALQGAAQEPEVRRFYEAQDVGTCTASADVLPGRPAQCERVILLQAEYQGDLLFGSDRERKHLEAKKPATDLHAAWRREEEEFAHRRHTVLLYD